MEEWRPIPGLEGRYDISNLGRVRHAVTGHIRKPYQRPGLTYQLISYREGRGTKSFYVHRAVLEAFKPRPNSDDLECHHRNFNPADNRPENLLWVTKAENLRFSWEAGRQVSANRRRSSYMTERHRCMRQASHRKRGAEQGVGEKVSSAAS